METTLGERLERALIELQVSQTELAKRSGVTKQAINYIINQKLTESKLAPKLANALNINPNWLMLGIGQLECKISREVPILNSFVALQKYLKDGIFIWGSPSILTEKNLGKLAFAFQTELKKVALCGLENTFNATEFLVIEPAKYEIVTEQIDGSFPIYEWRIRCVEF
ncbi:XRE family transcriptional regulator [Parashewanella curva]|uniref:XRE family transcriptional regulator n=1 Tax=Parashewanella curva TaxID=2338552 RepID=A0A3L8PYA6_9GAMM|nr:helix-turn-helix transcriptional regulator [Parashewanella curva]RLV60406.1 XRE family transcriptional regulator [Parashewanella curva]